MKRNHLRGMIAILAAAACLMASCDRGTGSGAGQETASDTHGVISTTPDTETPVVPVITEPVTTEPVTMSPETEPVTETETVTTEAVTETETDAPETDAETEETTAESVAVPVEPDVPEPIVPVPTVKPVIDLSAAAVCGGEAVTGQFVSEQSEHIRLVVDYAFEWQEDNDYLLTLDVGLSYYELWCSERAAGGTITVDGVSRNFASPAIVHDAHEMAYTPFFTQTYNCTGNSLASIDVAWAFNGTYGGQEIGILSAGAILQWTAPDGSVSTPPVPVEEETAASETETLPETETAALPGTDTEAVTEIPADPVTPDPASPPETQALPETETQAAPVTEAPPAEEPETADIPLPEIAA